MAGAGDDRRRRLGLRVIEGGKGKPRYVHRYTCTFCGLEFDNAIMLRWHWSASEDCGLMASRLYDKR